MRSSTAKKLRRARSLASSGRYTSLKALAGDVRLSESTLREYGVTLTGARPSYPAVSVLPSLSADTGLGLVEPQPEGITASGGSGTDVPSAAPGSGHDVDDGGGDDGIVGSGDASRPEEGPDPRSGGSAIAAAAATAGAGGAVGGAATALATGAGGVGVAFAGGAVGIAAGPVIVGGALVGAGVVLALKGLGVPVDEIAAKSARAVKKAAAAASPAVAAAVGQAIAASAPAGKRAAAGAGDGIRRLLRHHKPDMRDAVSPHARRQLYEAQQKRCNGCGNKYQLKDLTLDHIDPVSKGGTNATANLQLLCHNCNSIKGNRSMDYLRRRIERDDP